mgnify:CR=1 FL=1
MISCIICSRKSALPEELKENIASTIGCEYEVIIIDNSNCQYTIFSAYNEGVRRAKGDIVCFMHEDIIIHTQEWGKRLVSIFKDSKIGLVGVIGSQFLPNTNASWWNCGAQVGEILQGNQDAYGNYSVWYNNSNAVNSPIDCVVVDGCFMALRKSLFDYIHFDEDTFSSFHAYDLDICMQVLGLDLRVVVIDKLLIEHKSSGVVGADYITQRDIFYKKWGRLLPITKGINIPEESMGIIVNLIELVEHKSTELQNRENSKRYVIASTIANFINHPILYTINLFKHG